MSATGRTAHVFLGVVLAMTLSACGGGGEAGNSCTSGSTSATVQGSNSTLSLDSGNVAACGNGQAKAAGQPVPVR